MTEGPIDVDVYIQPTQGLLQFVCLFCHRERLPQGAEVDLEGVLREFQQVAVVFHFELTKCQGFLPGRQFDGSCLPINMGVEAFDVAGLVVFIRIAVVFVQQAVERRGTDLDFAVLRALETARWEQRHSELQELVLVHAVDHDFKALGERFEVAIDPIDALQNRSGIRRGGRVYLLQFMQGEFEIQLGNLVVDDENGLIRKRRDGVLQTQQRIEVDVIPIRQVVRIQ